MSVVLGQRKERAYKASKIRSPGESVKVEIKSSTMSLHIKKKKRQQMNAQQKHDERDDEKYKKQKHKNKNIDKSRTHLNKVLHREDGTYVERFDRVIDEKYKGKQKVRSNAVTMVEITVNLGGDVTELPMEEQNELLTNMYEYLKGKYPEVIGAVIHNDETNPGLHMSIVPLTEDGRLSAKEIFSKGKLQYLQRESLEYIQNQYPRLGFHRLSERERLYNGLSIEQADTLRQEREELIQQYEALANELMERSEQLDRRSAELDKRERLLDKREKELDESAQMLESASEKVFPLADKLADLQDELDAKSKQLDAKSEQLNAKSERLDNENRELEEHKGELQQTEQELDKTALHQCEENKRLSALSEENAKTELRLTLWQKQLNTEHDKVKNMRDDVTSERESLALDMLRIQQQQEDIKRLIEELKDATRVSKVRTRKFIEDFEESQVDS